MLRDYQQACIDCCLQLPDGETGYYRLPTGTGKTPIAGTLANHYAQQGRVLFLAHRIDLVDQGVRQMQEWAPGQAVGKIQAETKDFDAPITVACTATLRNGTLQEWNDRSQRPLWHSSEMHEQVSAILIDECHHALWDNGYGAIVRAVQEHSPQVRVIGCTATPFRTDGKGLLFTRCLFERNIPEMQQAGWLCPVRWMRQETAINLQDLKRNGDDYQQAQLGALMTSHTREVVELTAPLLGNRKTVVFAASVEHAQRLAATYQEMGLEAGCVWGDMHPDMRRKTMSYWKQGNGQIVCNYGILTEGFDYPELSGMVIARPTTSPGLYLQMLGRGTRITPGKDDCLVIDITGNPNYLDTRQCILTTVLPYYAEDLEPDADGSVLVGQARKENGNHLSKKPKSLRINDPLGSSKVPWGYDAPSDTYYATLTDKEYAVLLKNPRSGLYHGALVRENKETRQFTLARAYTGAVPLSEAVGHIHHIIAENGMQAFINKRAAWRREPASDAQLNFLRWKDPQASGVARAGRWTKGEVAQAITWALIRRVVYEAKEKLG